MKGQLSVNPIFTPLNIYRATVYLKNPVVAIDHTSLYLNKKSIPWDHSRSIINCTYSKQYQCLFLLCDDWKLYIYNKNLDQITKILNWQSKYTVGFELIQKIGILLMIGVGQVQVIKLNLVTNIKKTKFLSSVKFTIEKKQVFKQDPKSKLKWNKGYGYDLENNLLFLWSLQDINFYSLNKLELKAEIRNVVKKQQPITYVYFNNSYKYTVTGLINGNVKIWRLPLVLSSTLKVKNPNQYILIHNCIYHTKQVQKIVATQDDRVIFTQAADFSVCLWSLQTFQLLRIYNFQGQYSKIMLYDYHGLLAVKQNVLGQLKFGKTMQFITQLNNKIISFNKSYQKVLSICSNNQIKNRITQTQLTLESNMGLQIKNQNFKQKDLNKIEIQFFYPPLKSQQVKQVISCPFNPKKYYLLTEIGKIYKVRMQGCSSIIEYCYNVKSILDIQNHPLGQIPTLIKFTYIVPAEFDSQILQTNIIQKQEQPKLSLKYSSIQSMQKKFNQLKLITIGCNRGSVIFLPIQNLDRIYTRITYHRQQIVFIQTIYQKQLKNNYLISVCSQSYMKFVKFQQNKAICFKSIYLNFIVTHIKGFDDNLAVVLNNGLFQVMQLNNQQQLYTFQNLDSINHQGQILSIDVDLEKQLIITAATDNKIKIWTYNKVQLYQIFLDQGLKYAVFSNDYQIIVSHNKKLLYIRDINFSINKQQLVSINQEFLNKNLNNILKIEEFISKKKSKKKQQVSKNSLSLKFNIDQEYEQIQEKLQEKNNYNKSYDKGNSGQKQTNFKEDLKLKFISNYLQSQTMNMTSKKSEIKNKKRASSFLSSRTNRSYSQRQKQPKSSNMINYDSQITKKHLLQLGNLKNQINKPILPKIKQKNNDIFEQFMRDKLLNKKVLTRRDITLNRIIMNNIVKQNIGETTQHLSGLKLEF